MKPAAEFDQDQQELFGRLDDARARLNSLYKIADKSGNVIPFRMNWEQEKIFDEMHFLNLILKCRQFGGTTFIDLFALDRGHFNSSQEFLLTAHKMDDGKKIFQTKILDPYKSIPAAIRRPAEVESKTELILDNGSSFRVSTSARSGTTQVLHISEFGYICARFPDRAKEIVTGSLNAVDAGQIAFIESTAMGRIGYFYDYCVEALKVARMMRRLTRMEWRIFFFPWWAHPEYCMSEEDTKLITITRDNEQYFEELAAKHGIELDDRQKAWYVTKLALQKIPEDMAREYPSYPEEAFKVSTEGSYYGRDLMKAYSEGRVLDNIPFDTNALVHTAWDIGYDDANAIWFFQRQGPWINIIDYYENSGEGLPHYVRIIRERAEKNGWIYGKHFAPHDIENHEWASGDQRNKKAKELGLSFTTIPRIKYDIEGVTAVRGVLYMCRWNLSTCNNGILCLENFRKPWDEKNQIFGDGYIHDKYSHGAKAFESLAFGLELGLGGVSDITPQKAAALAKKYRPPSRRAA